MEEKKEEVVKEEVTEESKVEEVIDELVNLSEGNPQNLLSICQQFFNFMIIKKAKRGNANIFTRFREMSQLRPSEEILQMYKSLTDRQKAVFNLISKNIEMSYGEVSAKMHLARSTVTEHLLALKDKGLLDVKMKKVSIILLNYNNELHTNKCLDSLTKLDYPNFQVLIVMVMEQFHCELLLSFLLYENE